MFSAKSSTPVNRDHNKKLVKLIHNLLTMEESVSFRKPVAHKALGLDDYRSIIKKPTDLNLIRRQNNEGKYKLVEEVLDEIQLCWNNCKMYNSTDSDIYKQAQIMEQAFDKIGMELLPEMWEGVDRDQINKIERDRKKEEEKKRLLESSNQKNLPKKDKPAMYEAEVKQQPSKIKPRQQDYNQKNNEVEQPSIKACSNKDGKRSLQSKNEPIQFKKQKAQNNHAHSPEQNPMDVQQPIQPVLQPILVNLTESPTREQLLEISHQLKSLHQSGDFVSIEKILQILHSNEKQNMGISKSGLMTFNMQRIHISTYFRIKRVLSTSSQDLQMIIQ